MASQQHDKWPALHGTFTIDAKNAPEMYDAKFYPFVQPELDSVFAVTGGRYTFVCRPKKGEGNGVEIIRLFYEEDETTCLNSLCWTYDPVTHAPLVCVAGSKTTSLGPSITVYNVTTGDVAFVFNGHGAIINSLAISPKSPKILASASQDHTIRLWYLDKGVNRQPCGAIFAGPGGHQLGLLTIAFHSSGDYLLSGGFDAAVKLWKVPQLPTQKTGTDHPKLIHYPCFSTTEIHHELVDSVAFYGDLVLSKCPLVQSRSSALHNRIVLWRIHGFSATSSFATTVEGEDDRLTRETHNDETYSAFGPGFEQLLVFDLPDSHVYFMRFGLFYAQGKSPILAVCNCSGNALFWNLEDLEQGRTGSHKSIRKDTSQPDDSSRPAHIVTDIGGAFENQLPHRVLPLPKVSKRGKHWLSICYGVAWSVDGEWCVLPSNLGNVHIYHRTKT